MCFFSTLASKFGSTLAFFLYTLSELEQNSSTCLGGKPYKPSFTTGILGGGRTQAIGLEVKQFKQVIKLYPRIPSRLLFVVFLLSKDRCFTKDVQLTNPGDSYFLQLTGLATCRV